MKFYMLLILLSSLTFQFFAQVKQADSVASKLKFATYDAKHFKLDKQTWKLYRKDGINYTSDYFKPSAINWHLLTSYTQ